MTAFLIWVNIGCIGRHVISSSDFKRQFIQNGGRKYRVFKTGLIKALAPKYASKKIQHAFVDSIDKSVPRVTVWHHSTEPRDAKQCS